MQLKTKTYARRFQAEPRFAKLNNATRLSFNHVLKLYTALQLTGNARPRGVGAARAFTLALPGAYARCAAAKQSKAAKKAVAKPVYICARGSKLRRSPIAHTVYLSNLLSARSFLSGSIKDAGRDGPCGMRAW